MKQKAHAWIALRALKLVDDSRKAPKLAELLFSYLPDVWEGAWLPDTLIGNFRPDHIFKMDSDPRFLGEEVDDPRMRVSHRELDRRLTGRRLCLDWVQGSDVFREPYRSHREHGGQLPNRVLALGHTLSDMLRLADFPLASYARRDRRDRRRNLSAQKMAGLSPSPNFSARQAALSFFILSHYVADAHVPVHCDLRDYSLRGRPRRLHNDLHPSLEQYWDDGLPKEEELQALEEATLDQVVANLPSGSFLKLDRKEKFALSNRLPKIKREEWTETVNICRVSYAVCREWIPDGARSPDDVVREHSQAVLDEVSNYIFHDAVESVARFWLLAWGRYVE